MQQKPSAPLPATLPALPEFLPALLPAYCRDEVIGDLAEQYARKVQLLGRPTADKRLRGEVLGVLARLPWLWLRQHEIVQGPLHWQPIRLARVAAKRTELWYCCTAALRSAGQPVQTLRIIVYDKQRDAFLATRTREVGAGLMPPQASLAVGAAADSTWDRAHLERRAADVLAAMTDEDSEHLARRRWEHVTDAYQRGLGGFECRILALPVAGRRPALRPTIKGPSLWVEPGVFLAAVADDEVYCREAGTYRAGHLAATDRDDQAEHRPAR